MQSKVFSAWHGVRAGLFVALLASLGGVIAGQDVGYRGPSLLGSGPSTGSPSVTESKPESKLWYHDGSWWGSLWSASALAFHIHRLDGATHTWIDTGVVVETRPDSHSDALWDGNKLYIASHEFSTGAGAPGDPLLVLRYSYSNLLDTFTLDAGFPVTIGDSASEILVIDKDSTGTLWAVWKQASRVYYAHTLGSDTLWSVPTTLPGSTSDFNTDDICSVVHFGNRIGVLWSDQLLNAFLFSTHLDGAPGTEWSAVEMALPGESDDHINLSADSTGRVFAVVKNRGDEIKLLVRATDGTWQQFLVADATAGLSRATVLLDEQARLIHVFATVGPTPTGGAIYQKTSSLDAIAFAPGLGTLVIQDGSGLLVNNPTSTKANVTAETGIVVLAANVSAAGNYWHHEVPGLPQGNGLVLSVEPGIAGVENTFTVTGAMPGSVIGYFSGMVPGTSLISRPQCPDGIEIDLGTPFKRLGTARANAGGVATLLVTAPLGTANKLFLFQAIEPNSCRASNRVDRRMLPAPVTR